MRLSMLAAPSVGGIHATIATADRCQSWLFDRTADGIAYPGERVVRLPRRLAKLPGYVVDGVHTLPVLEERYRVLFGGDPGLLVAGDPRHVPVDRLIELARHTHRVAQAFRSLGQRMMAETFDAKRRVLLDDARQGRQRRPHAPRCDARAGYGFHVCAKDAGHRRDCRCRCGEAFGEAF